MKIHDSNRVWDYNGCSLYKGAVTMRDNPKPFEIYKHFKGNQYQILTLAKDSESGQDMVVYQALYGDYTVYVRELSGFMSPVDKDKYPDALQKYRFERMQAAGEASACEESGKETVLTEQPKERKEAEDIQKAESSEEVFLDPMVEKFLDADSFDEKLNILAGLHHRITDDMLFTMAAATDIELNEGSTEERFSELKECLLMKERFECNRLR